MSVEANTERVSSAEQRERYEREGYLVIDDLIAPETLDAIVTELEGSFGKPPREEGGVRYFRRRIQDAWKVNDNVKALALAPPVLGLLEDLYGRKPLPFQTLDFLKGTEQAAHSDAIHFSTIPEGYMCGVWVALEDVDMDNGPVVFYPGSHRLPFVRMADAGLEANESSYGDYERHIEQLIHRDGLEPRFATIEKGQALVWAANLLHGGAPQPDRTRSRHSQVTHYFFEDCRYWAPMVSEGDDVRWREPVWIR